MPSHPMELAGVSRGNACFCFGTPPNEPPKTGGGGLTPHCAFPYSPGGRGWTSERVDAYPGLPGGAAHHAPVPADPQRGGHRRQRRHPGPHLAQRCLGPCQEAHGRWSNMHDQAQQTPHKIWYLPRNRHACTCTRKRTQLLSQSRLHASDMAQLHRQLS